MMKGRFYFKYSGFTRYYLFLKTLQKRFLHLQNMFLCSSDVGTRKFCLSEVDFKPHVYQLTDIQRSSLVTS